MMGGGGMGGGAYQGAGAGGLGGGGGGGMGGGGVHAVTRAQSTWTLSSRRFASSS
jgi:hypothetical protein